MKVLLDTHAFLWWNLDAPELSATARETIANPDNEIFLSAASVWEIAIKYGKNRLELPQTPERYVAERVALHRFTPLAITLQHAAAVHALPAHHQDPFDRLLIAQSQLEKLTLLSADRQVQLYAVDTLW